MCVGCMSNLLEIHRTDAGPRQVSPTLWTSRDDTLPRVRWVNWRNREYPPGDPNGRTAILPGMRQIGDIFFRYRGSDYMCTPSGRWGAKSENRQSEPQHILCALGRWRKTVGRTSHPFATVLPQGVDAKGNHCARFAPEIRAQLYQRYFNAFGEWRNLSQGAI